MKNPHDSDHMSLLTVNQRVRRVGDNQLACIACAAVAPEERILLKQFNGSKDAFCDSLASFRLLASDALTQRLEDRRPLAAAN